MAICEAHGDALLDAIGLVKAQLDEDHEALRAILDIGDNRAQAAALARLLAVMTFMMSDGEPERVLGSFRAMYGAG